MKEAEKEVARAITEDWCDPDSLHKAAVTFGATALECLQGKHLRAAMNVAIAICEYSHIWKVQEEEKP